MKTSHTTQSSTDFYFSIAALSLRFNRYSVCSNINEAAYLYQSIKGLAGICLELVKKEQIEDEQKWVEVLTFFSTFKHSFHVFVALQEKGRQDETKMAMARFDKLLDELNKQHNFYFSLGRS